MRYDRTVIGYHGCDGTTAERLLAGAAFVPSDNDYDWLGSGIYFWEYGPDRAWRWAERQHARGKIATPAIVGAVIQLGHCFDLLDTRNTRDLGEAFAVYAAALRARRWPLPVNRGQPPDRSLRRLDCAVINWYLDRAAKAGTLYDSVRGAFQEGGVAFPGAGIQAESHIQLSVRRPDCILGVFRPMMKAS